MLLSIVWRNPKPLIRTEHKILRIRRNHSFAVYAISDPERNRLFSLISRDVAWIGSGSTVDMRPQRPAPPSVICGAISDFYLSSALKCVVESFESRGSTTSYFGRASANLPATTSGQPYAFRLSARAQSCS